MFKRWRQENFFKYLREEYALDALVDYRAVPDDPMRDVPNPYRLEITGKIEEARAALERLTGEYGAEAFLNPEQSRPTMRGFKIAQSKLAHQIRETLQRIAKLEESRAAMPTRIPVSRIVKDGVVKLDPERKFLTNLIKMVAYQAESDLVRLVALHYKRTDQEGRTLIQSALAAPAEQESEVQVRIHEGVAGTPPPEPLMLRLVIRRKDPEQVATEQKRLLKDAKKRGKQPDPRSLEAAKYILLLTSLPADAFPPADILALYRFRWQIELAFKRFKSLAGLDMLPAKKPELARAWIYARLIVAIIAEQIAGQVPDSSPSGPDTATRNPIALASHEDSPDHHLRRHSWTAPVADAPQHVPPNLASYL